MVWALIWTMRGEDLSPSRSYILFTLKLFMGNILVNKMIYISISNVFLVKDKAPCFSWSKVNRLLLLSISYQAISNLPFHHVDSCSYIIPSITSSLLPTFLIILLYSFSQGFKGLLSFIGIAWSVLIYDGWANYWKDHWLVFISIGYKQCIAFYDVSEEHKEVFFLSEMMLVKLLI